ncbi:MAG: hypothetical protein QM783_08065 [Phycisphaerales bacterium]
MTVGADERVVLLGRQAGERLEPVGVVRCAAVDRPVLHRGGHHVGELGVELLAVLDGPHEALEGLLGETLAHGALGEDVLAVELLKALALRPRLAVRLGGFAPGGRCGDGFQA